MKGDGLGEVGTEPVPGSPADQLSERRSMVSMQANEHSIRPSNREKLLGCIVSDKLKWIQHILENEQS